MFKRGWKQADATVVVARNYVATADNLAGHDSHSDLVVEVHPSDEPAFRAETSIHYLGFKLHERRMTPPTVGETIRVEYRPKNHEVKVLLDETHDRRAIKHAEDDEFQAALAAPVGASAPAAATSVISDPPPILVQSDGDAAPVEVATHALDPSFGGAAGILARGAPCRATLLAVVPMPGRKTSTGEDATGLVLAVTAESGEMFQAQIGMYVPPAALARLAPGADLPGRTLPSEHNDAVAIDWNAFLAG